MRKTDKHCANKNSAVWAFWLNLFSMFGSREDSWTLICFCIQSILITQAVEPLRNSTVGSQKNGAAKGRCILSVIMKIVWPLGFAGRGTLGVPRPCFENSCLKPTLCTLAARVIRFPADLLSVGLKSLLAPTALRGRPELPHWASRALSWAGALPPSPGHPPATPPTCRPLPAIPVQPLLLAHSFLCLLTHHGYHFP